MLDGRKVFKTNPLEFSILLTIFPKSKKGQSGVVNSKTRSVSGWGERKMIFLRLYKSILPILSERGAVRT